MRRSLTLLVLVGSTLGLVACAGDTDPATNITNLSARLNFHGSANNGPAYSYFEYWMSSTPNDKSTTPTINWPAGANGSFGQTVTGLSPNVNYSFRVCGGDQGQSATCASTESFTALRGTSYAFDRKWGTFGSGNGQFDNPSGVAVDSSANVYVADWGNDRVQKFSSTGTFLTKWGSYGSSDGQFNAPQGVSVDLSGNVYVADSLNHRIQKFNSTGGFLAKWGSFGSGDGQFITPTEVAASREFSGGVFFTRVYVADLFNDRIQKFGSTGSFLAKWGSAGSGDGQFDAPTGVGADPRGGNLYVADSGNDRIQWFSPTGSFLGKWGTLGSGDDQLDFPSGVAVDSAGLVYVADTRNDRIQKFSPIAGAVRWGSSGSGDGQFNSPNRVAVDKYGYVYVADTNNNRIQKFKPVQ